MEVKFSFPIRNNVEIIATLNDFGFSFTEEDLTKPQPENIRRVYEKVLAESTEYSRESRNQFNFQKMSMFVDPALHDESIGEVAFVRSVTRFMKMIGVHDFGTRDIFRPEYQRTKRAMSAIINFALYRDEKINKHLELSKIGDELVGEHARTKEEAEIINDQLDQLLDKKSVTDKETAELKAELLSAESTLQELMREHTDLRNTYEQLLIVDQELAAKIDQYTFSISSVSQEITHIESMVVRSPDKVKRTLENMEQTLRNEKDEITRVDDEIKKIQYKFNKVEKMHKDMKKTLSLAEKATEENQKYKKVKQVLKDLLKKIEAQQKSLKDLDTLIKRLDKSYESINETMASNQQRHNNNKDQWNTTMLEVENENKTLRREQKENEDRCFEIDQQILNCQQVLEEEIKQNDDNRRKIVYQFEALVNDLYSFHQHLDRTIESPPEKIGSDYQ